MSTLLLLAAAAQSVSGCLVEAIPAPQYATAQAAATPIAFTDRWIVLGNASFPSANAPDGIVLIHERGPLDTDISFSGALESPIVGDFAAFGLATAVHGDVVVVGAPGPLNTTPFTQFLGAVFVYRHDGAAWQLEATLASPHPQQSDRFATSVAISSTGGRELIAVGASGQNAPPGSPSGRGAVFLYGNDGSGWTFSEELNPSLTTIPRRFGERLAFDGRTLVTRSESPSVSGGSTHIFRFDETFGFWREESVLPDSVGFDLDGDTVYTANYDRFADRTDIIKAVRDPALATWSPTGPPLFSVDYEASGLGFDAQRVLVTRRGPPRLSLFELDANGAWSLTWQPERIEAERNSSVPLSPSSATRFSRDQLVLALGANDVFFGTQVFLVDPDCAQIGEVTCIQPGRNSTGRRGKLRIFGSASIGDDDVTLQAVDLPPNVTGLFFAGRIDIDPIALANSEGLICIGGDLGRFKEPHQICTTSAGGDMELSISPLALPTSMALVPALAGESWFFQAWHRDVRNGVLTSNVTSARQVVWQ